MTIRIAVLLLLFVLLHCTGYAQDGQLGECELDGQREKRAVEFIFDTRSDSDASFIAKEPCTNKSMIVRRCAIVNVRKVNAPRSCIGTGRPDYSEEIGIVEYWEAPKVGASAK